MDTSAALRTKTAALWLALAAAFTVGAALVLQYGYGYVPCKLCLTERLPYYAAVPLGVIALFAPERSPASRSASPPWACSTAPASASTTRAPSGASGRGRPIAAAGPAAPGGVGDFLQSLNTVQRRCSTAALRVLGISLAGWSALVSFALASLAGTTALRP